MFSGLTISLKPALLSIADAMTLIFRYAEFMAGINYKIAFKSYR
jgi:hypothetical protein